jgi:plastocyanin
MRPGRPGFAFRAAAAAALALAPPASAAPRVDAPRTYTIEIKAMKFAPAPAGLKPGDRVIWVNHDIFRHSATSVDHSFDLDLPAGGQGGVIIRKAGPIPFSCKYHPGMKGVLAVGP